MASVVNRSMLILCMESRGAEGTEVGSGDSVFWDIEMSLKRRHSRRD